MALANLAWRRATSAGPASAEPLRGQNNVQGSCDMGSFPHELSGYRHISDDATRTMFEKLWGRPLDAEPGLRIPNMFDAAIDGTFMGIYVQGETSCSPIPTPSMSRQPLRRWSASSCRTCS